MTVRDSAVAEFARIRALRAVLGSPNSCEFGYGAVSAEARTGRYRKHAVTHRFLFLFLGMLFIPACRITAVPLFKPPAPPADALPVERVVDKAYYSGKDADDFRHRLDLFLPKGKKDCPVLVLVHGGHWSFGDKNTWGLYSSVGEFLARQGIIAVLPNYRLSPAVKHPEHVKDVARALAWTKAHIAEYGGRADQIFVAGHSAGGHLVTLLATDDRYLKAEELATSDIKGVIGISGVYRIPPGDYRFILGGRGTDGIGPEILLPLRGKSQPGAPVGTGVSMRLNAFGHVFGDDPAQRADASPVNHVRAGLPPFLLFSAEYDYPMLPAMAKDFQQALKDKGCEAEVITVPARNHNSLLFQAIEPDDPVAHAILEFVKKHSRASGNP
jgi:acetyl esterase/lipase